MHLNSGSWWHCLGEMMGLLELGVLMEEVYHWGQAVRFYSQPTSSVPSGPPVRAAEIRSFGFQLQLPHLLLAAAPSLPL